MSYAVNGLKVCSYCKRELGVIHFHRNRTRKDGFMDECRECILRKAVAMRKKHGDKVRAFRLNPEEKKDKKYCPVCKRILFKSEFYSSKNRSNGISWLCKKCENIRALARARKRRSKLLLRKPVIIETSPHPKQEITVIEKVELNIKKKKCMPKAILNL